jgi:histidine triad (HIT) family protein
MDTDTDIDTDTDDCRFCRIVCGDRDAHVLYDDAETTAFLDANPATEAHVLVVPNVHVEDLLLAEPATTTAVVETAQAVATTMERTLDPDGFSVFHTTGGLVGQVEHAHLHLLPRFADDDVHLALDRDELDDSDAERVLGRVRGGRG